ncbi:hypothetical protein ID866_5351 [Astraeus odoratus]|nr:hypothetical protein ID866_5351 [Astraeus odoratus]
MSRFVPSLEGFAKGTLATFAGVGTIGCGLLYYGQNYLIYPSAFPPGSRTEVDKPDKYGLPNSDLELRTEDGVLLRCYLMKQTKDIGRDHPLLVQANEEMSNEEFAATRPTVLMFHGNGGNLGHRIPLARIFYVKMRCNVLMLSYRGYGHSGGTPSENGLCIDAQTALNYVLADPDLQKTPVILYGQSIGGAVAIDLASRNPFKIHALILENTFTSLPRLIPHALPLLSPVSFLCHQKWDSASKVPLIPRDTPILMLSGLKDEVVPQEHMAALWEIATRRQGAKVDNVAMNIQGQYGNEGDKKNAEVGSGKSRFVEFARGYHNDTCTQPGYWTAISEFVTNVCS